MEALTVQIFNDFYFRFGQQSENDVSRNLQHLSTCSHVKILWSVRPKDLLPGSDGIIEMNTETEKPLQKQKLSWLWSKVDINRASGAMPLILTEKLN